MRDELGIGPDFPGASLATAVDFRSKFRALCVGPHCSSAHRTARIADTRNRNPVVDQSRGSRCVRRHLGGAPLGRAALRVTMGGTLAMAVTALIGRLLGVSVGD